jgi:hypothetical protein
MKCQNNIKQLSLALHNHHDALGYFPPSGTTANSSSYPTIGSGYSTHAFLLPYIEQDNLYRSINFSVSASNAANNLARGTAVQIFLCPSDHMNSLPAGWAGTNYRCNNGANVLNSYGDSDSNGNNASLPPPNGGFFTNSKYKFADITDGTSNTAAFSEHLKGDFSSAVASPNSDTFEPGTYPSTPDEAMAQCNAINPMDLAMQGNSNGGAPWLQHGHTATRYWHNSPPGGRSCMFPPQRISTTANGAHVGVVNVGLFDGSVRTVPYSISLSTWRALGTRNGGDLLGNDW